MGKFFQNIKNNTYNMSKSQKLEYILTYYWYHILGIFGVVALAIFVIIHFVFADNEEKFFCAIINQEIDYERDENLAYALQERFNDIEKKVIIDSNYNFSYKNTKIDDENKGIFEKFFFQWANGELNVVIATEDFLSYCVEAGGEFYPVTKLDTGRLDIYDKENVSGIMVADTQLHKYIKNIKNEELVIAFPNTGKDIEACQKFINYCQGKEDSI